MINSRILNITMLATTTCNSNILDVLNTKMNGSKQQLDMLMKECRIGPRYVPTWFLAQEGYHRRNHKAHEDIGLARPRDTTWRTR
jgi:hypothetical protein